MRDVRRAMQHGNPQMTTADLLGNPLPADLVAAQSMDAIRIAWRKWLGMRVKIVDEYNRIPTRTPERAAHRHGRQLRGNPRPDLRVPRHRVVPHRQRRPGRRDVPGHRGVARPHRARGRAGVGVQPALSSTTLLARIEEGLRPEDAVPRQIIFSEDDRSTRMQDEIRAVELPAPVRRRLEFFRQPVRVLRGGGRAVRVQDEGHRASRGRGVDADRRARHRARPAQGPRLPDAERTCPCAR